MLVDVSGKVTVITGAGRGIGEALAHRFGAEGARLALWERDATSLARVTADLKAAGVDVVPLQVDVSDADACTQAAAATHTHFGDLEVLINNAGVAPSGTVESMDIAAWDETFAVNVRGVFLCCRAVTPFMKARRGGRIISASSFAAIIPSYAFAAYASSKAAVASFTRVLAAELGPWDVTVNAYAPGMVPTQMNGFTSLPETRQQQLLDTLTLRRWGAADDVASLLVFLASAQAGYISGTLIDVSGGKFSVQFPQMAHQQAGL